MSNRAPTVFQRLRTLKGAWVLMVLALFIKIASATACTLDGPSVQRLAGGPALATDVASVQADARGSDADEVCLLGEPGGCHCACAHTAALPSTAPLVVMVDRPASSQVHVPAAAATGVPTSPLRPPIA